MLALALPIRSRVEYTRSISQMGTPFSWVRVSLTLSLHTEGTSAGGSDLPLHSLFEAVLPCRAFSTYPTCTSREVEPLPGHSGVYRRTYTDVDEKMGPLDLAQVPRRSRYLNRPDRTGPASYALAQRCPVLLASLLACSSASLHSRTRVHLILRMILAFPVKNANVWHATVRSGDILDQTTTLEACNARVIHVFLDRLSVLFNF
jgi:hypothetical protein